MLPHRALCCLAAGIPKTSPHDLAQVAHFLRQTTLAQNATHLPAARALLRACARALATHRSYATASAATKPTATIKKAVKAKAAERTAPAKKVASSTRKTTKTKAVAKKATSTKKAPRKKAAPKKPAAKKKVVKKKAVKKLSVEEKEKAAISELRRKALKAPVSLYRIGGLQAYVIENTVKAAGDEKNSPETNRERFTKTVAAYKSLTPAQHEHYNHLANERNAARRAEYKAWIESYTPKQIEEANRARAALRRKHKASGIKLNRSYPAHTEKLIDERQPKRPMMPYTRFSTERWASGDFKGIEFSEANKLISQEWKALTPAEKEKYQEEDGARADAMA